MLRIHETFGQIFQNFCPKIPANKQLALSKPYQFFENRLFVQKALLQKIYYGSVVQSQICFR